MFWQEPPTYFRSMATVFIPFLARVQEMSLPARPAAQYEAIVFFQV